MSAPQTVFAVMCVVLGVLTYYVAPAAFLYKEYTIFFLILNCLLIMLILGMTFLCILILPYLQMAFIHLFIGIYRKDQLLKPLIRKNLQKNQKRNVNTAIMFAMCLSFLIFAGSTFMLIGKLITSQLQQLVGADFYATIVSARTLPAFLDEAGISNFLQEQ